MRTISSKLISKAVASLCLKANTQLRSDVRSLLNKAKRSEKGRQHATALSAIVQNAEIALREKLAIWQDTGMPVVVVEIGNKVYVK